MQNVIVLAIIVVAIIVASLAGRSAWKRSAARAGGRGRAKPAHGGELVAVIAAVAAASGMEIGSFRVVGVEPTSEGAAFARRGLNTPAWGHVERFIRLGE